MIENKAYCDMCGEECAGAVVTLSIQDIDRKPDAGLGIMPAILVFRPPTRHFCDYTCAAKFMHYAGYLT